jgi:hypothetical protein
VVHRHAGLAADLELHGEPQLMARVLATVRHVITVNQLNG